MVQKIVTFNVALKSTERQWVQKIPEVYTNDLNSVSIQFNITDCNDLELTGSSAIVLLKMRDGSFFQGPSVDVSRTLNVFSYTLKENEGNHDGLAEIQLIVTIAGKEFGTQKYQFKVNAGLDSEVAREIMIYDWTSLTTEARAYIDQFTADELVRDAEFDNSQFDRNAAFGVANTARTEAFDLAQAQRVTDFNAAEAARVAAFNIAHDLAGTDHTTALNDSSLAATARTNAATDRTNAATDRTNAATDRNLAGTDHTTALADHAILGGYNGRLTDVETDTSFDATNLGTNGDFSNGITGWTTSNAYTFITNGIRLTFTSGTNALVATNLTANALDVLYIKVNIDTDISNGVWAYSNGELPAAQLFNGKGSLLKLTNPLTRIVFGRNTATGTYLAIKLPLIINLTAVFGAGNEPTAEQMDGIMAKFTNSWFNGTANLFRANATLNKLMVVDARTEFEAKNAVTNGDLSNGTTGWNSGGRATLTVANNTLSMVGTGTSGNVYAETTTNLDIVSGNKLYATAKIRATSASVTQVVLQYRGESVSAIATMGGSISNPIINQWYTLSAITTMTSANVGKLLASAFYFYPDATTANGKTTELKYITFIDLTAAFGAGKEPTLAEMDRLMARFPNSWFDGVKPIQTIETLYQEKANKTQEAWITPTLLNGWLNHDGAQPLQYRKDEFGMVHFRGKVIGVNASTAICTLPVGYRPVYGGERICSKYNTVTAAIGNVRVSIESAGTVTMYTTTTANERFDLGQLSFPTN